MRFTCTSNIERSSISTPAKSRRMGLRRRLFSSLISRQRSRKPASFTNSSSARSPVSARLNQPSPIFSVINAANDGFASATQRRGVTPFVTLTNFCGSCSLKSRRREFRTRSECIAATPFTCEDPMVARFAIRTLRGAPSSMIDMRDTRDSSPGQRLRTSSRNLRLIS